RTMTGRRRLVPELLSRNGLIRMSAERETVNMPIQGTAADILKKAMIDVHAALEKRNAASPVPSRMIRTVHDELLFEAPEDQAAAFPSMAPPDLAGLVVDGLQHLLRVAAAIRAAPSLRVVGGIVDVVHAEGARRVDVEEAGQRTEARGRPVRGAALIRRHQRAV